MSIDVLLFASYADAFGSSSISLDVPDGTTVADMLVEVRRRPGGEVLPRQPLVAVNERFASHASRIVQGDEVALIPPVAGG